MRITLDNFDRLIDGSWDYDNRTRQHMGLHLYNAFADIGGGKITIADIDVLKGYPNVDTISVSGLNQYTFEYLIQTYGKQLRAIRFFKNKLVEDWSLLGTLPELEFVYFYGNQRITSLWKMEKNYALQGLAIEDFSKLHSIQGIERAPALRHFEIGNAVWGTSVIESLKPLTGTCIQTLRFSGKAIEDRDLSFLPTMKYLEIFDFATNLLPTEQVAWIVANCPDLKGYALTATQSFTMFNSETGKEDTPAVLIVGKRKPSLAIQGNEVKIQRYVDQFDAMIKKYKDAPFPLDL